MLKVNLGLVEGVRKKTKSDMIFFSVVSVIVLVMCTIIMLNTFVFFNVQVKGPSMEPTMRTGDVLVANRHKAPTHGSIVIISGENPSGKWIIKRVIAMEGDTVDIRPDGYVWVKYAGTEDYVQLEENYLKKDVKTDRINWNKQTIGKDEIFYLGDNRTNSLDSRTESYSTCNVSQIVGVVENWSFSFRRINKLLNSIFN